MAAERLLIPVGEIVMSEPRRPPESLVTQAARVRPIVGVLPLVGFQYKTSLEGFSAFLTDVGAHVTVLRVPVGTEGVRSVGAVVTIFTGVWLLTCEGKYVFILEQCTFLKSKSVISINNSNSGKSTNKSSTFIFCCIPVCLVM